MWSDLNFIQVGSNGAKYGKNTIILRDLAGNESSPYEFYLDNVGPKITVKEGSEFTTGTLSEKTFSKVSFGLYDDYLIKSFILNGKHNTRSLNKWSDINYIGVNKNGGVAGLNSLTVYDLVGNSTTYEFNLDNIAPVLKLKGANTLEYYRGESYDEKYVNLEATDDTDANIQNRIFTSKIMFKEEGTTNYQEVSKVDTSRLGIYYVYYQVKDLAGNLSNVVSRGVKINSFSFTASVESRNLEYIEPIIPSTSYSKQGGGFQLFSATLDNEINCKNLSLYYAYGDSATNLVNKSSRKKLPSSTLNYGVAGAVSTKINKVYPNGIMPAGTTVNHQKNALLTNHKDFANKLIGLSEGESVYVRTVLVYTLFGYEYEAPIGNFVKYTKSANGKISMEKY